MKSEKEINLTTLFSNPNSKAGQIELMGDLITVSTKDDGTDSEVLILTK